MCTLHIEEKRYNRRLRSKQKKLFRNRGKSGWLPPEKIKIGFCRMKAPEAFSLHKNTYKKVLLFFKNLREKTLKNKKTVIINFKDTSFMTSSATLMLIAEIDRIQSITSKSKIRGTLPNDKIASQVFCKTGLSKLLGIEHKVKIDHETVTYWDDYLTGEDGTAINAAKKLQKIRLKKTYKQAFFMSLSEAITNISMHAYYEVSKREDNYSFSSNKWWMFTGCDNEQMTLVICDIGKGIPVSLQERKDFNMIKSIINSLYGNKNNDSKAIKAAMEIGTTSSKLPHRGKGMMQLKQAIDTMKDGTLSIYSNRGHYEYSANGEEEYSKDLEYSIMGTIVIWSAPLNKLQKMIQNEYKNDQH